MAQQLQTKRVLFNERTDDNTIIKPDTGYVGISKLIITSNWNFLEGYMTSCTPAENPSVSSPSKENALICFCIDETIQNAVGITQYALQNGYAEVFYKYITAYNSANLLIHTSERILHSAYGDCIAALPTYINWKLTGAYRAATASNIFDMFYGHCLCAEECQIVLRFTACPIYDDSADPYCAPLRPYTAYFANTSEEPSNFYLLGMHSNGGIGGLETDTWDSTDYHLQEAFLAASPVFTWWEN